MDNVLRPMLVGEDAKMPDLLILIGTLGGLFLLTPVGFIAGPMYWDSSKPSGTSTGTHCGTSFRQSNSCGTESGKRQFDA
jgi:hypothetical protein